MSYLTGIIFACLAMAIVIGMVHQACSYLRGRQIITGRQCGLRMATGGLLLAAIAMIFYAAVRPPVEPRVLLAYWAVLSLLPVAVIILAWLDLREVARLGHRRQAELYHSLAQLQQEVRQGAQTPRESDETHQPPTP